MGRPPDTSGTFTDLAGEDFEREWKPIHDAIFTGRYAMEGTFRDPTWAIVVLPNDWLFEEADFDALASMAAEGGDTVLVLKDAEIISPPEPARVIPMSFGALDAVWRLTCLSGVETHMFGRSATWGCCFTKDDFHLVAGQPRLMERFISTRGGRERLVRRFMEFSEGVFSAEFRDKVLKLAGWST